MHNQVIASFNMFLNHQELDHARKIVSLLNKSHIKFKIIAKSLSRMLPKPKIIQNSIKKLRQIHLKSDDKLSNVNNTFLKRIRNQQGK
jgi:flavorubredoxin